MLNKGWRRIYFIVILTFVSFFRSYSQNFDYTRPSDVISPSPMAASLFKDVNVPVNYYTGTPEINIPLHVINGGKLKMPIHLKYTATGIRVEQEAGLTGLAWDLQTGGVISRAVIGKADEVTGGIGYTQAAQGMGLPDPGHDDSLSIWLSNVSTCDLQKLGEGKKDLCPDSYFLNFNGNSARMFFDKYGQPYFSPYKKWKVTGNIADGFTVITEDGTTYVFDMVEHSTDIIETAPLDNSFTSNANTSWYLSQIISADKSDTVRINYTSVNYSPLSYHLSETHGYFIRGQIINNAMPNNGDFQSTNRYTHGINGYIVSDIITKDEKVVFYTSMGRTDIVTVNDGMPYKLDSIGYYKIIPDGGVRLLSKEVFNYDYYNSSMSKLYQRLRLTSIYNEGANGEVGERFRFHYDGNNALPARNSFAEDAWGFYNNNNSNTLIPEYTDENAITYLGADRSPDTSKSIAGLLTSIEYPTGGTTSFQYEAHAYNGHEPGERDSVFRDTTLRIQTGGTGSTGPTFDSVSFYIPYRTIVNLDYSSVAKAGQEGDVLCWLASGQTAQLYPNLWLYVGGALSHNGTYTIILTEGTYTLCVQRERFLGEFGRVSISFPHKTVSPAIGVPVGGARIKKIVQSDGNTQIIKKFMYLADEVTSSGILLSTPVFSSYENMPAMCTCSGGGQVGNWRYMVYHSMPTADLGRTQGSHICYTRVTVTNGENGENGKEEYDYQYTKDIGNDAYPFPPRGSKDDLRGQLLERRVYDVSGKLVERDQNTYNLKSDVTAPNFKQIWGVKVGIVKRGDISSGGCPFWSPTLGGWDFNAALYPVLQLWPTLASTRKVLFSTNSNDSIVTIEQMSYDAGNLQLSVKKAWNSKGDLIQDDLKYPTDFAGTQVYDAMVDRNMITPVIENTQHYNTRLRSKGIMNYQLWPGTGGMVPLPVNTQLQIGNNPIETRLQYLGYDSKSNLLSQRKSDDAIHSYIWDYWGHRPIAEAINATSEQIAYTSFEWDGTGGFSIGSGARIDNNGITGNRYYDLSNGIISKTGLSAGNSYIVSYWSMAGNYNITGSSGIAKGKKIGDWTYYQHSVTGVETISVSGNGGIDELRLYPKDAQMTSFTYDPLVGMTSQCDVANRVTYYEYDGLQRLKLIRDQDHNILKTYEYQYQAASGCGPNCYVVPMQTFAGGTTLGYPVGVFNVNGKLLGNATDAAGYVSKWNLDPDDALIGTLAAGADPMRFNITLNAGKTLPAGVTGCRYYQVDLEWNQIDGIRNWNAAYVDFGDGAGMHLGPQMSDRSPDLAPNTVQTMTTTPQWDRYAMYSIHTYTDNSLKTITLYHNDGPKSAVHFDNVIRPATSLTKLKNLRGNIPQGMYYFGVSSNTEPTMLSIANITNWSSIHSIEYFLLGSGDGGVNVCRNVSYPQDFMAGNKGLDTIFTGSANSAGYFDAGFKLSKLKADWNTYFTNLRYLSIMDDQWDREDLTALTNLSYVSINARFTNPTNDPTGNPLINIPPQTVSNIIKQVWAGAGQYVEKGILAIYGGGLGRLGDSDNAFNGLLSKGWTIVLDNQTFKQP